MLIPQEDLAVVEPPHTVPHSIGHAHFWERALSRRGFIRTAAGVTAAAAAAGMWAPALAHGMDQSLAAPLPIPGGVLTPFGVFIHHWPIPKQPGNDPSQITNFKGFIGVAGVQGKGTGIDTSTGARTPLVFDMDNRFMKGVYIGADGRKRHATFAFI
jgi:hypothetical protein